MDLASRFGSASAMDIAWRRVMTSVASSGTANARGFDWRSHWKLFGGNGYVKTGAMGRLFREAPVNSIWEGSGNVMCLDVPRATSRNPATPSWCWTTCRSGHASSARAGADEQAARCHPPAARCAGRQARRLTQRLALVSQACLMLRHVGADKSAAFVESRFHPTGARLPVSFRERANLPCYCAQRGHKS